MTRADAAGFPQDYRELFADAYVAELAAFVAACRGEGPPGPTLEDDRRAVAIGVAARASAVAGRPLEVGPDWPWPSTVATARRSTARLRASTARTVVEVVDADTATRSCSTTAQPSKPSSSARTAAKSTAPWPNGQKRPCSHASSTVSSRERTRASSRGVDVLQVQVRDAAAGRSRELDRVAAADDRVARVEGELHERRVGRLEQRRDLVRALDVGRGVRMERRRDAAVGGALARRARPARRRGGSRRPSSDVSRVASGPARGGEPDLVLVAGEHDRPAGAGRGEDLDRPVEEVEILLEPLGVARSGAARTRRRARARTARAPRRPPPASAPK